MTTSAHHHKSMLLIRAIILTLILIISVRYIALVLCEAFGFASAANIVGMLILFVLLMVWRAVIGLPQWLTQASNALLADSGFAFLPVSAGAGILLFTLGDELIRVMLVVLISTLLPLWALAKLSQSWLNKADE